MTELCAHFCNRVASSGKSTMYLALLFLILTVNVAVCDAAAGGGDPNAVEKPASDRRQQEQAQMAQQQQAQMAQQQMRAAVEKHASESESDDQQRRRQQEQIKRWNLREDGSGSVGEHADARRGRGGSVKEWWTKRQEQINDRHQKRTPAERIAFKKELISSPGISDIAQQALDRLESEGLPAMVAFLQKLPELQAMNVIELVAPIISDRDGMTSWSWNDLMVKLTPTFEANKNLSREERTVRMHQLLSLDGTTKAAINAATDALEKAKDEGDFEDFVMALPLESTKQRVVEYVMLRNTIRTDRMTAKFNALWETATQTIRPMSPEDRVTYMTKQYSNGAMKAVIDSADEVLHQDLSDAQSGLHRYVASLSDRTAHHVVMYLAMRQEMRHERGGAQGEKEVVGLVRQWAHLAKMMQPIFETFEKLSDEELTARLRELPSDREIKTAVETATVFLHESQDQQRMQNFVAALQPESTALRVLEYLKMRSIVREREEARERAEAEAKATAKGLQVNGTIAVETLRKFFKRAQKMTARRSVRMEFDADLKKAWGAGLSREAMGNAMKSQMHELETRILERLNIFDTWGRSFIFRGATEYIADDDNTTHALHRAYFSASQAYDERVDKAVKTYGKEAKVEAANGWNQQFWLGLLVTLLGLLGGSIFGIGFLWCRGHLLPFVLEPKHTKGE